MNISNIPADQSQSKNATTDGMGLAQFAAAPVSGGNAQSASGFDIGEYVRTIVKWKNLIAGTIVTCVLLALLSSYLQSPLYSATSQVIMNDTASILPTKADGPTMLLDSAKNISTQIGLINSNSQAQRVVARARLAQNPAYADQSKDAKGRADQATRVLLSQLHVENVTESRLINITITSPSAGLSADLANVYAQEFIASNLDRSFQSTSYAREFLEKQLQSTRQKLEDSERHLVDYASQRKIIELGVDKEGNASRSLDASTLVHLNDALADARIERISAAQNMRAGNTGLENAVAGASVAELRSKKAQLEAEYQQKAVIFLPDYPEMRSLREQIKSLDRGINGEQQSTKSTQSNALRAAYLAASKKEAELASKVDALKQELLQLRNRSIEYTILQREVDTNRVLYEGLLQKYKEVGVSDGVGRNDVSIVDNAKAPSVPISPNIPLNLLMGLIAGVILGFGGAFLIEFASDSVNQPEEVARKLNLPLLGVMSDTEKGMRISDAATDPKSEVAEAANSLRTALQFTTTHGAPKSILLTSSRPAEGKSSVSFALSLAFARQGKKVLLVDADMRKPTFHSGTHSRESDVGLSNVLSGLDGPFPVHKTEHENLWLMTAGPIVPNPADLLSTHSFSALIAKALSEFDIVIADGPPVLGLADALLLGAQSEATIMIVKASEIRRSEVLNALNRLRSANVRVVGAVLNRLGRKNTGYGYGYTYGYGHNEELADAADDDRRVVVASKD